VEQKAVWPTRTHIIYKKEKRDDTKRVLCIYTLALKSYKAGFNLYRNKVELIFSIRTKIPITSRDKGLEGLAILRRSLQPSRKNIHFF
jgi:hypothetical protein